MLCMLELCGWRLCVGVDGGQEVFIWFVSWASWKCKGTSQRHISKDCLIIHSFTMSLSPSSWRCPLKVLQWREGKPCVGRPNNNAWLTTQNDPEGRETKQIAQIFSLGLYQVERLALPLDIIVLLLHPEDDGRSLAGLLFLVNLRVRTHVQCVCESLFTAHVYSPPPHRWTQHMKPGGLMQRVSGALWILRRRQEG